MIGIVFDIYGVLLNKIWMVIPIKMLLNTMFVSSDTIMLMWKLRDFQKTTFMIY